MKYRNFDLKDLEREYSPSSCINDINIYIQQYIEQSRQALSIAKQKAKVLENIKYGNNSDENLDLFLPFESVKNKHKLQVYIHGGYWQELTKDESSFAATNFQQHGYYFAVLNYSLAPKVSLTDIIEQNRQALKFLYLNATKYGYDKNEIYLSGSSAGGHLAMMMAYTDWSKYLNLEKSIIKGICAVSGIYDLTPIAKTYINKPLQLSEIEISNNSPLLLNPDNDNLKHCAIILTYGDNETSEFKRQSMLMKEHLIQQKVMVTSSEIQARNHFDVIIDLAHPDSWLSQQVFKQMS